MAKSPVSFPQTDEWLRPKDAQQYLKIGANKYYQLVKDGAFPTHKPDPNGRLVYVRKSDIDLFLLNGFSKAIAA